MYLRQALSPPSVTQIVAEVAEFLQSDLVLSSKTQWLVAQLRAMA